MAKTNIVDWKTITDFVVDAFVGYGIPKEDAEICADVLLESDKRGIESHGVEGMFSTNPFTIGVPTDEEFDFNFDCATSITQNGKVEYYERIGEDIARKKAGEICRSMRASKKAPDAERIYTAGEKEYEIRLARKDGVPINESVQKEIIAVRDELGLTQYKFPWED